MAASYQTFATSRTTEPDASALLTQLRTIDATIGVQHTLGTAQYRLKKDSPWTGPQITAAQSAIDTVAETTNTQRFQRTSREKDVLATCALIVRSRDIPGWTAASTAQKKTAVQNEADVWVNIREFIETNL